MEKLPPLLSSVLPAQVRLCHPCVIDKQYLLEVHSYGHAKKGKHGHL